MRDIVPRAALKQLSLLYARRKLRTASEAVRQATCQVISCPSRLRTQLAKGLDDQHITRVVLLSTLALSFAASFLVSETDNASATDHTPLLVNVSGVA